MDILTPAAVHLRELHRQELLDIAARERLASTAVSGTTPELPLQVRSSSVGASVRSEVLSRVSLLGRFAHVAATNGRPLYRVLHWS